MAVELRPPKALLFDLDNTLVPEMDNYELAFARATEGPARQRGVTVSALREAVFTVAHTSWLSSRVADFCTRLGLGSPTSLLSNFPGPGEELAYLREWAPTYRHDAWVTGLIAVGLVRPEPLARDLSEAFRESLRADCLAYDDVLPALKQMAGRYALAVTTNGPEDVQDIKLRASGLRSFFPTLIASSAVGAGKPDPAIFIVTLDRLDARPEDALVIGDNLENDVAGARAAGLRCVWVNRTGAVAPAALTPEFEVRSLAELPALLGAAGA